MPLFIELLQQKSWKKTTVNGAKPFITESCSDKVIADRILPDMLGILHNCCLKNANLIQPNCSVLQEKELATCTSQSYKAQINCVKSQHNRRKQNDDDEEDDEYGDDYAYHDNNSITTLSKAEVGIPKENRPSISQAFFSWEFSGCL